MAALSPSDLRMILKGVPVYSEQSTASVSFRTHLRTFRLYASLNGLVNEDQLKGVLLYSLRGRSSDRAQHLISVAVDPDTSFEAFIQALGQVFMPESESLVVSSIVDASIQRRMLAPTSPQSATCTPMPIPSRRTTPFSSKV